MKLYNYALSPFAARVRLSIYRKGLDVEIVPPPDGGLKTEAFLALNPMGRVPTLVTDAGFPIPESAAILEYLEDVFPTPSLRPEKPEDLARARLFLRLPDIYFENAPRILMAMRDPAHRKPEVVEASMGALTRALSYIDHYVDAATYAVGGRASIADCALVPVLNVVSRVGVVYGQPELIDGYKNLGAYWRLARVEEINARVIAEQLAVAPK